MGVAMGYFLVAFSFQGGHIKDIISPFRKETNAPDVVLQAPGIWEIQLLS